MSEAKGTSVRVTRQRRAVLTSLRALLETIGSANDAEDHGYRADAGQMREDSCEAIRGLLAEHAFLKEILPSLQSELDTRHILGFGWASLCDGLDEFDEQNR